MLCKKEDIPVRQEEDPLRMFSHGAARVHTADKGS
jgi:hypothetical protein